MNSLKQKTHKLLFILLGLLLFISSNLISNTYHLAPQSTFIQEAMPVFLDKYLADLENLRANLATGQTKQIEQIIKTLPPNFNTYQFNNQEEVKNLLNDIVSALDYAIQRKATPSFLFDNYIKWLETAFPDIFSFIKENEFDLSTEAILQVLSLLTENVFQHGAGQCILIIGSTKTQHYFSLISKGEFKNVKGALIPNGQSGAVRGKNSNNGLALSESLEWYLSELNDFLTTYYAAKNSYISDVLISGRDGKFSYNGFLADKGYSPHNKNKGGASATFILAKNKLTNLQDFFELILETEDTFLSAA